MQTIKISPDGQVKFIWNDNLLPVFNEADEAKRRVTRASHVEPTADGRWTADLGPVGGPVLGPYTERGEALRQEVLWLNKNVIGVVV